MDDDSEVVDDPVLQGEDNRLHSEKHHLHGEDDDDILPHVPDILPDVPDVENKIDEEDDVKGHGGQDSQEEEVYVEVSKAEITYFYEPC